MTTEFNGSLQVKSWEEKPTQKFTGGPKLSCVFVTHTYEGVITGEGTCEYVMYYRADGTAIFVGVEHVVGSVAGREGSFGLRHNGAFEGGTARSAFTVITGSGTGDLAAVAGTGSFVAAKSGQGAVLFAPVFVKTT